MPMAENQYYLSGTYLGWNDGDALVAGPAARLVAANRRLWIDTGWRPRSALCATLMRHASVSSCNRWNYAATVGYVIRLSAAKYAGQFDGDRRCAPPLHGADTAGSASRRG